MTRPSFTMPSLNPFISLPPAAQQRIMSGAITANRGLIKSSDTIKRGFMAGPNKVKEVRASRRNDKTQRRLQEAKDEFGRHGLLAKTDIARITKSKKDQSRNAPKKLALNVGTVTAGASLITGVPPVAGAALLPAAATPVLLGTTTALGFLQTTMGVLGFRSKNAGKKQLKTEMLSAVVPNTEADLAAVKKTYLKRSFAEKSVRKGQAKAQTRIDEPEEAYKQRVMDAELYSFSWPGRNTVHSFGRYSGERKYFNNGQTLQPRYGVPFSTGRNERYSIFTPDRFDAEYLLQTSRHKETPAVYAMPKGTMEEWKLAYYSPAPRPEGYVDKMVHSSTQLGSDNASLREKVSDSDSNSIDLSSSTTTLLSRIPSTLQNSVTNLMNLRKTTTTA